MTYVPKNNLQSETNWRDALNVGMAGQVGAGASLNQREATAAEEIVRDALGVCERAKTLVEVISKKLGPVIINLAEEADTIKSVPCRPYPPLFDELRSILNQTRNALDRIAYTIDRVDL